MATGPIGAVTHQEYVRVARILKYSTASLVAFSILGSFYYYEICSLERGLLYSCGDPLTSLKINVGLSALGLSTALKTAGAVLF